MWSFRIETDWARTKNLFDSGSFINQSVFGSWTLLDTWVRTYEALRNLQIEVIIGSGEDGNQCVFPMCIWRRNWKNGFIRTLMPIGYSDYDYNEPLFAKLPNDMTTFWKELLEFVRESLDRQYDKIVMIGIRSAYHPYMEGWEQGECCPQLSIEGMKGEDDLFGFLKTSLRGDIRRQIRRLQEMGELTFHTYTDLGEVENTYDSFINAHISRWPDAYKASGFHRNMLKAGLGREVHFSSLDVNGKPIAWHLGFTHNGVYYYYMPCGAPEWMKFSPVKVHLFMLIADAIKRGSKVYDHLRGEENYKQGWSDSCDYVWQYTEDASSLASKVRLLVGEKFKVLVTSWIL